MDPTSIGLLVAEGSALAAIAAAYSLGRPQSKDSTSPPTVPEPAAVPPPTVPEPAAVPPPTVPEPAAVPPPTVPEPAPVPPPTVPEPAAVPPPTVPEPAAVPPPTVPETAPVPPPPALIEPPPGDDPTPVPASVPSEPEKTLDEIVNEAILKAESDQYMPDRGSVFQRYNPISRVKAELINRQRTIDARKQKAGRKRTFRNRRGGEISFEKRVSSKLYSLQATDPRPQIAFKTLVTVKEDRVATLLLPVFNAFLWWRYKVLLFPLRYTPVLVADAESLFEDALKVHEDIHPIFLAASRPFKNEWMKSGKNPFLTETNPFPEPQKNPFLEGTNPIQPETNPFTQEPNQNQPQKNPFLEGTNPIQPETNPFTQEPNQNQPQSNPFLEGTKPVPVQQQTTTPVEPVSDVTAAPPVSRTLPPELEQAITTVFRTQSTFKPTIEPANLARRLFIGDSVEPRQFEFAFHSDKCDPGSVIQLNNEYSKTLCNFMFTSAERVDGNYKFKDLENTRSKFIKIIRTITAAPATPTVTTATRTTAPPALLDTVAPVEKQLISQEEIDNNSICVAKVPEAPTGIKTQIPGDGWCYYSAVLSANNEPSTTEDAIKLAQEIQTKLRESPYRETAAQQWTSIDRNGIQFEDYLDGMATIEGSGPKYWGEGDINSPIVAILKRKIVAIYTQGVRSEGTIYCPPPGMINFDGDSTILIDYNGLNHYDAYVKPSGVPEPVPEADKKPDQPVEPEQTPIDTLEIPPELQAKLNAAREKFETLKTKIADEEKKSDSPFAKSVSKEKRAEAARKAAVTREKNKVIAQRDSFIQKQALEIKRKTANEARDERARKRAGIVSDPATVESILQKTEDSTNEVAESLKALEQERPASASQNWFMDIENELQMYFDYYNEVERDLADVPPPKSADILKYADDAIKEAKERSERARKTRENAKQRLNTLSSVNQPVALPKIPNSEVPLLRPIQTIKPSKVGQKYGIRKGGTPRKHKKTKTRKLTFRRSRKH